MPVLPILMYHGLHADERCPGFDPVYSVHPDAFVQQLDWLVHHGYQSVRLEDVYAQRAPGTATRPVVLTFDDGDLTQRTIALPLLVERGLVAEFFVTTGFVGRPEMLEVEDARALAGAGMGVQSHGCSHRFLTDLSEAELDRELTESREQLERWTACPVTALALPGGRGRQREVERAFRFGYRHVLSSVPGQNRRIRAPGWWERIAVTRDMRSETFGACVRWRGLRPRVLKLRHAALSIPKQLLGDARYGRLRERALRYVS